MKLITVENETKNSFQSKNELNNILYPCKYNGKDSLKKDIAITKNIANAKMNSNKIYRIFINTFKTLIVFIKYIFE